MSEEIKRMKYETGLFMTEEEFKVEQEYHMRMRRLHNRHLHTAGIVWGLDVVPDTGTYNVYIQPGMALDVDPTEEISREIIVNNVTTVDLSSSSYAANASVYLWIQYREEEADASVNADGQAIHWLENFTVGHGTTRPDNENLLVLLGKIILDSGSKVSSIEYEENGTSLLQYAGVMSKQIETDRLTLSDDAISESNPYIDGTLFLPDGIPGLDIHSDHTQVSGNVEIEGKLKVKQSMTTEGKTYMLNDVSVTGTTSITGNTNVTGNLTVTGTNATINAKNVLIKDDVVTLNSGESGTGVSSGSAGFDIDRGIAQAKARLLFDESSHRFKAGLEGSESKIIRDVDLTYVRAALPTGGNQKIYFKRDPVGGNLLYWNDDPAGSNWRPFA